MTDFSKEAVDTAIAEKKGRARKSVAVAVSEPQQLMQQLLKMKDVDVGKAHELVKLSREMERDQSRRAFSDAMALLQAEITPIARDASNPQTRSRYASYEALDRALRPHYTRHGFSVRFDSQPHEAGLRVVCIVSHGAWSEESSIVIPITTTGIKGGEMMTPTHATGSALTYGKRYSLAMAFNLAVGDDDDGNRAGAKTVTAVQAKQLVETSEGHDTKALFERYGIRDWSELPQAEFKKVLTWMEAKKGAKT